MKTIIEIRKSIEHLLAVKGLPAAIRLIVRIYERWGYEGFNITCAVPAVHISRWVLGQDKNGNSAFEPKSVTDDRFKMIIGHYLPPDVAIEDLVIAIANTQEHIDALAQILFEEQNLKAA